MRNAFIRCYKFDDVRVKDFNEDFVHQGLKRCAAAAHITFNY